MQNIGKQIEKYRLQNNMTQKELGSKVFVASQTVSKWENGTTMPSIETLNLLAQVFNVPVSVFIGEDNQTAEQTNGAEAYIVERTKQYPKRNLARTICFGTMVAVFLVLCIVFFVQKMPFIPFVMLAFLVLSLLLLGVSIFFLIKYNKAEFLPAKLVENGIIFSDGQQIEYKDISSVSASPAYEKAFFKVIGSNFSAYTFGKLKIIAGEKIYRLYYIENVIFVRDMILKKKAKL